MLKKWADNLVVSLFFLTFADIMTYSVVGMGAIGGYYGGQLAKAGREVHFLSHSDYEHVLQHGLQVDSCNGNFYLPHINAYGASQDMPKTDIIVVGLKSVKNHDVLSELLRPIIHEDSVVVLIQNGIGLEDDLQAQFPGLSIVAGLAFICSAKVGPGHINHQCYGSINLGNYSCPEDKFKALTDDFADKMIQMTDEMVPYSPSMKLDYDFHRPMEIYYLYSRPIEEAKKVGFEMPKLAMLEAELKFIETIRSNPQS